MKCIKIKLFDMIPEIIIYFLLLSYKIMNPLPDKTSIIYTFIDSFMLYAGCLILGKASMILTQYLFFSKKRPFKLLKIEKMFYYGFPIIVYPILFLISNWFIFYVFDKPIRKHLPDSQIEHIVSYYKNNYKMDNVDKQNIEKIYRNAEDLR